MNKHPEAIKDLTKVILYDSNYKSAYIERGSLFF